MKAKSLVRPAAWLAVTVLSFALAACGDDDDPVAASPVTATVSGTAAVGAPLASAAVTVQCATGTAVNTTTTAAGAYTVSLTGQALPCLVTVTSGTPPVTLRSMAQASGTVNVTPLTDLIVTAAAGTSSTAWFEANKGTLGTSLAALAAKLPDAKAAIRASLTAAGYTVPAGDFLTAVFEPKAGDSQDDLLEALAAGLEKDGISYEQLVTQVAQSGTNPADIPPPSVTAFDSLPSPLPMNVPSYGFSATQLANLGDKITFAANTPRKLHRVTVLMSSWACQTGAWNTLDCASAAGATYNHPVTLSIYAADGTTLLASKTQTFAIPYRPSKSAECPDGRWKATDGTCNNGTAFQIGFDMDDSVTLPDTVLYKVAFNTRAYGTSPMGVTGPYDALNVGVSSPFVSPTVGTDVEPGTVYKNGVAATDDSPALMVRFDTVK